MGSYDEHVVSQNLGHVSGTLKVPLSQVRGQRTVNQEANKAVEHPCSLIRRSREAGR
jgi:hypothetical protein